MRVRPERRGWIGAILAGLAAGPVGLAQPAFPEHFQEVVEAVHDGMDQSFRPDGGPVNYAAASLEIARLHARYAGDPERLSVFAQIAPPWMVATGHLELGQETWDVNASAAATTSAPDDVIAVDAIVAASRGRRVVMLNEAHHVPMHRAFGRRVVRALAAEGFTHLAVEALANSADAGFVNDSIAKGRPTVDGGFYLRDPMFGELLRAAFESGMTIVPYETTEPHRPGMGQAESINAREAAQAGALARVLQENPDARMVVFCGYSHLTESPQALGDDELRWLACRLRDTLGIDPLTISQTQFSPTSAPEKDSQAYRDMIDRFAPRDVVALRGPDGALWSPSPGSFDIAVVHPRIDDDGARPAYMLLGGERTLAPIPTEWLDGDGPRFVQAIPDNEDPADAVPAEQRWIDSGGVALLALRPGRYLIRVYDDDAKIVREESLLVGSR